MIKKLCGSAAPSNLKAVNCSKSGAKDGSIENVSFDMEYSTDCTFKTNVNKCTGSKITGLSKGTYYVRYSETSTQYASVYATVTIK